MIYANIPRRNHHGGDMFKQLMNLLFVASLLFPYAAEARCPGRTTNERLTCLEQGYRQLQATIATQATTISELQARLAILEPDPTESLSIDPNTSRYPTGFSVEWRPENGFLRSDLLITPTDPNPWYTMNLASIVLKVESTDDRDDGTCRSQYDYHPFGIEGAMNTQGNFITWRAYSALGEDCGNFNFGTYYEILFANQDVGLATLWPNSWWPTGVYLDLAVSRDYPDPNAPYQNWDSGIEFRVVFPAQAELEPLGLEAVRWVDSRGHWRDGEGVVGLPLASDWYTVPP